MAVFVIPSPRERFTENEFNTLKGFLDGGGSVLVTLGEGGEKKFETNINYLLEEYGIMINNGEFSQGSHFCNITNLANNHFSSSWDLLNPVIPKIFPDIFQNLSNYF